MKFTITASIVLLFAVAAKASNYAMPETYSSDPPASSISLTVNPTNTVDALTTNETQRTALDNAIKALGIGVTNYSVDIYGTYAPSVPAGHAKFGGGLLALYDFNQNAGAGIGIDWLGQFSLVSGDLQLQAPFHLSSVFPSISKVPIIGQVVIDPFAIGGVGTPYSGNGHFNGSAMVISDLGGAVEFGHLWGGQFNAGIAWGKWIGSGPFGNVTRYHAFAGYNHGIGAIESTAPDIGP